MPSRMSCSLTTTSAKPNRSMIRSRTSAPAPITSTRPGCITPIAAAARGSGQQHRRHLVHLRRPGSGRDGSCRVVGGQAERDAGHRGHRPGQARPASGPTLHGYLGGRTASSAASMSVVAAAISASAGGSACRCRSVIRTQPMSTETPRAAAPASAVAAAEHELGRPAADVDDQVRRRAAAGRPAPARQLGGGAGEGQAGLLVAAEDLRRDAEDRGDAADELGRVRGVAGGAGRDHPDGAASAAAMSGRVLARARANVRSSASGASRPVASTPWPSRTISIRRSRSVSCAGAGSRRRSAAGASWCRSRSPQREPRRRLTRSSALLGVATAAGSAARRSP